jgi:decaprenyl-phosphate phosphoribosyltransferase
VRLSSSFLLVTSACAIFLIVGKRYAEVTGGGAGLGTRPTLRRSSPRALRGLLAGSAALGCVAYARWSFGRPELGPWLALSLVPFAVWLGRYATRVGQGVGEAPEELVLRDRALLALGLLWAILFTAGIYGAR